MATGFLRNFVHKADAKKLNQGPSAQFRDEGRFFPRQWRYFDLQLCDNVTRVHPNFRLLRENASRAVAFSA